MLSNSPFEPVDYSPLVVEDGLEAVDEGHGAKPIPYSPPLLLFFDTDGRTFGADLLVRRAGLVQCVARPQKASTTGSKPDGQLDFQAAPRSLAEVYVIDAKVCSVTCICINEEPHKP